MASDLVRAGVWFLGFAFVASTSSGCGNAACDPDGQGPQRYSGGNTNEAGSFYESSSWDGPFLYFPSGRRYRLMHGLSERPTDYGVVLSFAEYPFAGGGGVAESAGNQAIVENVTEDFVEVRNDTCAEFFLRLWARVAPFEDTPATSPVAGDAGP